MTNAIPNQYAQIWYRRKAREKIKRVTWLDFRVRRWAWRCGRKQVSALKNGQFRRIFVISPLFFSTFYKNAAQPLGFV